MMEAIRQSEAMLAKEQERRKQADPQTGSGKRPAGASLLALRKAPRT